MLTTSARSATLKKKANTPCQVTVRRMLPGGHRHIGDLRGHADDQGEIEEIPIVRFGRGARESQAAGLPCRGLIEFVSVVGGEDKLNEKP